MMDGNDNRLLILTYHRVPKVRDELIADPVDSISFERQMTCLRRWFNVLPLRAAVSRLSRGSLPPRAVSITFDDGYRDNFTVALPILRKYDLSATFFVTTGVLGSGRMWNDTVIESIRTWDKEEIDLRQIGLGEWPAASNDEKRAAINGILKKLKYAAPDERSAAIEMFVRMARVPLADDLMMNPEHVSQLSRSGMEIGAHTVSHPILARIPPDVAKRELSDSRAQLEELTVSPVRSFAYPNGRPGKDYHDGHVEMVRALGFEFAVSTTADLATTNSDVFQLPRMAPWQRGQWKFSATYLAEFWRRRIGSQDSKIAKSPR